MSYILFISGKTNVKRYINGLSKKEAKNHCFLISHQDNLGRKHFPDKATVKSISLLIPPASVTAKYLEQGDLEKFSDEYCAYLSKPFQHASLNYIVKNCIINGKNMVVCFGDTEDYFKLHKYIKSALKSFYPKIKYFTYKDWEDNSSKVKKYDVSEDINIVKMVMRDTELVKNLLRYMKDCDDGFNDAMYNL